MFRRFRKSQETKDFLALDIGTEYVKALVFSVCDGEILEIKATHKERQDPHNMAGGMVADIEGVANTCKRVIEKLENETGTKLSKAIVGVAGESIRGGVMTVHYERARPETKITPSELRNVIQRVQWRTFDRFRNDFLEDTGQTCVDVRIVDAQILKIKIDAYEVVNPVDFQGKDISFDIFNSIAPMIHLESIKSVMQKLGLKIENIVAEPCAIANLLCSIGVNHPRSLLIDIGGGTTDMAIIKDGMVDGVRMFSLGGRAYSNRISEVLGVGAVEAEDIKVKYSAGELSKNASYSIRTIFKKDSKVWIKGIKIALEKFLKFNFYPSTIYLCGGGCMVPEIKESIEDTFTREGIALNVEFLYPNVFSNRIQDHNKLLVDTSDIASIGLANVALLKRSGVVEESLCRAVRMMQT
ncbi:hypothetical protein D4R87_03115 [bacterium]|nr:MAG: hypothetical protein D4R87_03115 [bacterium]